MKAGERSDYKKHGQVTIFIILAILILSGVILFFIFRQELGFAKIPTGLEPVYASFLSCLEEDTLVGIDVLESQAGYIEIPDFEPGSNYMPFSSQLDFLGNPIPYWYYVSGNNIEREQVPSKSEMEEQLGNFIEQEIRNCRFDSYYENGFEIFLEEGEASVEITDREVVVSFDADLTLGKGDENVVVGTHEIFVDSELGAMYDSAIKIYNYEQESLFLENYGIDVLRLYAPVDGIELTCSPLIWNANKVFSELQEAIETNTERLKTKSDIFSPNEDKYFISEISVPHDVRFLNSRNWSSAFEVNPSEEEILISSPVGTQPGLGILGFCYVPYHFVYDMKYPVLVQVSGKNEVFQFPFAVVIQGNKPRKADESSSVVSVETPDLCGQKNTMTKVNVFDSKSNMIDADVSYECSGTRCYIGKSSSGIVEEEFPQCVNGFIIAKAEGFEESKELYSVVQQGEIDVFLDKIYEIDVQLKLDNKDYNGQATINFVSENKGKTIVYPEQRKTRLSEGQYEIQAYIYRNSSLTIGSTTGKQCVEIPSSGIGGFFGASKEKCFNVDFPAQIVSNALAGGGKQSYYILESELENSNIMEINAQSLPLPDSLNQLQENYILFDEKNLQITFK